MECGNSQPPPRRGAIQSQVLTGGLAEGAPKGAWIGKPLSIESGGSRVVLLSRSNGSEIRGSITVNGLSEKLFIPAHTQTRSVELWSCGWGPGAAAERMGVVCNQSAPEHFHFSQNDPSFCQYPYMRIKLPPGEVLVPGPVKFVYLGPRKGAKNENNEAVEAQITTSEAINEHEIKVCGWYGGIKDAWLHSDTMYRLEYQTRKK